MSKPASHIATRQVAKLAKPFPAAKAPAAKAPAAKATTLRLNPALQRGLEMLQGVLKKPINKMVNEAVEGFIAKRSVEVEANLKAVLAQIKAHRRADPNFKAAIAAWAHAEATLGKTDAAEGVVLPTQQGVGPTQTMVRELLGH